MPHRPSCHGYTRSLAEEIRRCEDEQAQAAESYRNAVTPADKRGALLGVADWTLEEAWFRLECSAVRSDAKRRVE
jgi:hypothetical protein